jgi:fumarate reductase subunit C
MRFTQAIYARLPDWARPDDIMQHYARGRQNHPLRRSLFALISALIVFSLVAISLITDASGQPLGTGGPRAWMIYTVLYFPLLVIQLITLALALLNASAAITNGPQWEALKITSHGAEFVVRARWAATLYRLRDPLLLVIVPRLLFAGLMLVDVTRDGGYHLDLYLYGITPGVPLEIAVIMLAALMTAALLQFPVLLALNAALGLLISTTFNRQAATVTARLAVLIAEIALVALALNTGWDTLQHNPLPPAPIEISTPIQWAGLVLLGTIGDQGLRFMDLETTLHTWPDVNYGVCLGGILLLIVVAEIVAIRGLLVLATRRAARPSKE